MERDVREDSAYGQWLEETQRGDGWRWDWPHLRLIQEELDRITLGSERRLMLFLPPRHGKSELVTVRYPVYRLERDPGLRVILGAYNQHLAERFSRKGRRIARARLALSRERSAAADWETVQGGSVRAAGVGTGVTGLGADLIVIDDPVKSREEAESPAYRDRVWEWYTDDLYTRQEPEAAILLIMTRWHEDDLAGRILRSEEGPEWRVVRLPALAETPAEREAWLRLYSRGGDGEIEGRRDGEIEGRRDGEIEGQRDRATHPDLSPSLRPAVSPSQYQDPLGRAPGAALWPKRYNEAALTRIQSVLGPSFSALYQGRPNPATGGLFRREWFQIVNCPPPVMGWVRFWDTAAKAGQRHDYWAGAKIGRTRTGEWYIADIVRGRWEYPDGKRVVLQTAARDGKGVRVGIEDSTSGTVLLQDLRRDPAADGYGFWPVPAQGDKAVRAGAWASLAQGGLVYLVAGHWNQAFLDELEQFPYGAHDDQIDAVSGAYALLLRCLRPRLPVAIAGPPRPEWSF